MISIFPFQVIFITTLIIGTLTTISAPSWFIAWLGLEVNLLSFIPIITSSSNTQEAEAAVNYFLAQAAGSALLLTGSFFPSHYLIIISITGLVINIGLPPAHFWFPITIASLPWSMCILLTTWQNIAPLSLLIFATVSPSPTFLLLVAISASLIGGFIGMNQSQLRPLLAYSSIGHLGWILALSLVSPSGSALYFALYVIITLTLITVLLLSSLNSLLQTTNTLNTNPPAQNMVAPLLLSLGGLPPLSGFIPNLLALDTLAQSTIFLPSIILILGSLINLFYYLSISFSLILPVQPAPYPNTNTNEPLPLWLTLCFLMSTVGTSLTALILI